MSTTDINYLDSNQPTITLSTPQRSQNQRHQMRVDVSKPFEHKQIDTRWTELKMNKNITSRSYFASCIQAGKVYIHGGYNEEKGIMGDMYSAQFYDLPSEWVRINNSSSSDRPPNLRNHTMCAYTSYLILIGGQMNMLSNNDKIYIFDLRTNEWRTVKINFTNGQADLCLDSHIAKIYNDHIYVFGGYNAKEAKYLNATFKINLQNIKNLQVNITIISNQGNSEGIPSPRGSMSSCIVDDSLYLFGGTNSDQNFDDFWQLNLSKQEWVEIPKPSESQQQSQWPQKRKGQIMVTHAGSRSIFMFGGIREITKQQNDIMVYLSSKKKWIRIHRNTNQLYDPSPTIKQQIQNSPSIIDAKNRKNQSRSNSKSRRNSNRSSEFKLGIQSVTCYNNNPSSKNIHELSPYKGGNDSIKGNHIKTQQPTHYGGGFTANNPTMEDSQGMKKRMTVVQEKKYRQFMNRKKKLLNDINNNSVNIKENLATKRSHSPTSQTLVYSINTIGQQKKFNQTGDDLPKVIFDQEKGALIGKKPCARDGHAGLAYEENIIIIGGDRHMISFNDVYLFRMDKAIQNIHHYQ